MQKPNGYDNVSAGGNFIPIEVGGHHLVIMDVKEMQSKKGYDMLVVSLDTAKNDKQPEYFKKLYKSDTRSDKKWPNNGVKYIMVYDYNGDRDENGNLRCSRDFKAFITSTERSNPGFTAKWGDNFGAQFKGKRVGGVYGLVENFYNGKMRNRSELRWFCDDAKADSQPVPELKKDKKHGNATSAGNSAPNGFIAVPDNLDGDELPFD